MKHSKMSEALKVLGITRHTFTQWERLLPIQIPRDENGHRIFPAEIIEALQAFKAKMYNLGSAQSSQKPQTAGWPEY